MAVSATKGGRFTRQNAGVLVGPASYVIATGQPIYNTSFGVRGFTWVGCSMSVSGTYYAMWDPVSAGVNATAYIRWFVTATGVQVANTTNLSAEKINLLILGG